MKSVALRIRMRYFDAIKNGEKKIEYRKFSEFRRKTLENVDVAVFVCGKRVHRREITKVEHIRT